MNQIPFKEALAVWLRIGLLSFGGPAGQIALMHRIIVDEKKWLPEHRFLHALNYCMLLPGPEAQQLATYVGWLLHGVRGGVVAGVLFILPGALAIFLLTWAYVALGDLTLIEGVFFGLKAAVLAIVAQALMRIGQRALTGVLKPALAVAGFLALFVFSVPFPIVVLGAGLIGYVMAKHVNKRLLEAGNSSAAAGEDSDEPMDTVHRPGTKRAAIICLALWVATVGILLFALGPDNVFSQIAVFFSTMATVTFGGAYAVLAYVAQQGVEHYQWLQPGEMLEGLGLAETTPGPLILVTQFVGFLAAYREATMISPLFAAFLGALLTTWVTFLPCFLWIFAGAPYVEKLRNNQAISSALAAITAVVVGVIANLALWFAVAALFSEQFTVSGYGVDMRLPYLNSVDWPLLTLSAIAFITVFRFKLGVLSLIGSMAGLGVLWTVFAG
jgi:chromate transporter